MDSKKTKEYGSLADPVLEANIQEAKRAVHKNGINLSVAFLIMTAVALVLQGALYIVLAIVQIANGVTDFEAIMDNVVATLNQGNVQNTVLGIFNIISLYFVAFPIFCLMSANMKRRKYENTGFKASHFFMILPVMMLVMTVGSAFGNELNAAISSVLDFNVDNPISSSVGEMPLWLVFLMTMVGAPIVEEYMFRKVMIGTLGRYGSGFAIIISSVAFGLFHGNLYQFFYCFLAGLLLGYVYVKSGKLWVCMLMHSILNFLGGVLPLSIEKVNARYTVLCDLAKTPEGISKLQSFEMSLANAVVSANNVLNLALIILGLVFTVVFFVKGWHKMENDAEAPLPKTAIGHVVFSNPGAIICLTVSALCFLISMFS